MRTSFLESTPWRQALAAGALAAGSVFPSSAAVYSGQWDPLFGGNFTNLAWEGEVLVDIPDACLALGSGYSGDFAACDGASVLSATLTLYNANDPSDFEQLDFAGPDLFMVVYGFDFAGGKLTGLYTGLAVDHPVFGQSPANPGDWLSAPGTLNPGDVASFYADYQWGLFLDGSTASLQANSTSVSYSALDGFKDNLGGDCPWDGDYAVCSSATAPVITFTPINPVPEPGSLALVGLAGMTGLMAWRRGRRQPSA